MLGATYRVLGRYQEAIAVYKEITQAQPDYLAPHIGLAATYMLAGMEAEARAEAAEVLRISPNFSVEQYAKALPWKNPRDLMERLVEPLRKAGLK